MNLKTIAKCTVALVMAIESIALVAPITLKITPVAEAQCRVTGRTSGGIRILKCTGGKSCCRKTGRTRTIRGNRYEILDCSRCR
jgi:hypothetical protein